MAMIGARPGRGRRSRVAVLSKKALATHPYDRWRGDGEWDIVLFAEDTAETRAYAADPCRFAGPPRLFRDWKRNRLIDAAVIDEHRERPFDRIVALSECDLLRAAQLRDRLGIPGQSPESARAFRDKPAMKSLAAAAGLAVPAHRVICSACDLMDFAHDHGGHIAVKPVDGSGSAGVRELQGAAGIEAWIERQHLPCDDPTGLMAEEWIDAPMLSVDGLMRAGAIEAVMTGEYTRTCLSSLTGLMPHGILLLDPGSPRAIAARDYVERLLRALPAAPETMSFHCELFDHPERGLLLCEIACRTGGGNLNLIARKALGVDLERAAFLGQAGVRPHVPRPAPYEGRVWGDIVVPRSERRLPGGTDCRLPGVVHFTVHQDQPGVPRRAAKVSDYVIDALLTAPDHKELRGVYDAVHAWLDRNWIEAGVEHAAALSQPG